MGIAAVVNESVPNTDTMPESPVGFRPERSPKRRSMAYKENWATRSGIRYHMATSYFLVSCTLSLIWLLR